MLYYAAHCGGSIKRINFLRDNQIRCMVTAADYRKPYSSFALDNGAWSDYVKGLPFNSDRFLSVLDKVKRDNLKPDFVVLPDIVNGGVRSYDLTKQYMYLCDDFPCYFPIQPSMTPDMVLPYVDKIKGLFMGGGIANGEICENGYLLQISMA